MSGLILSCGLSQVIETWPQQMVGESLLSQQWFVIVHVTLLRRQERRATCTVLKWSQVQSSHVWAHVWAGCLLWGLSRTLIMLACSLLDFYSEMLSLIQFPQWISTLFFSTYSETSHIAHGCIWADHPGTPSWSKVRNKHCKKAASLNLCRYLKEAEQIVSCSCWLLWHIGFELTKVNPPLPMPDPQLV